MICDEIFVKGCYYAELKKRFMMMRVNMSCYYMCYGVLLLELELSKFRLNKGIESLRGIF